jgi:hypothetical protein
VKEATYKSTASAVPIDLVADQEAAIEEAEVEAAQAQALLQGIVEDVILGTEEIREEDTAQAHDQAVTLEEEAIAEVVQEAAEVLLRRKLTEIIT